MRGRKNGRKRHGYYHRLIGLSLLHCMYDDWGNLLAQPVAVDESTMEGYQVHHWKGRWWACKTDDFIIVVIRDCDNQSGTLGCSTMGWYCVLRQGHLHCPVLRPHNSNVAVLVDGCQPP